jgi:hypothetical protein
LTATCFMYSISFSWKSSGIIAPLSRSFITLQLDCLAGCKMSIHIIFPSFIFMKIIKTTLPVKSQNLSRKIFYIS